MRKEIWKYLTIGNREFENERVISIQTISLFAAIVIGLTFPVNLMLGLDEMAIAVVFISAFFALAWMFSRYFGKPVLASVVFAITAFVGLGVSWYANGGSYGPSVLYFLLSLMLFMAILPWKWHMPVFWVHIAMVVTLMWIEYVYPDSVPQVYNDDELYRTIDVLASILLSLITALVIYRHVTNRYARAMLRLKQKNQQLTDLRLTLQKINDEKDRLFSVLAHDLRSPLASLEGALELMKENMLSETERVQIIAELQALTHSSMFLVENLLYWSKYETGDNDAGRTTFSLCDVLSLVEAILQPMARKKGVELKIKCDEDFRVTTHRSGLEVLIRNVVHNGIKFTQTGGHVHVVVSTEQNSPCITITDDGVGLDPACYTELVSGQSRHSSGTSGEPGTGLGLALIRLLSKRLNLKTTVDNPENSGTRFTIQFPESA